MKKIRNTIILILAFIFFVTGIVLTIHFSDKNKLEKNFQSASTTVSADELLLKSEKTMAKALSNSIYLSENKDIAFDKDDKDTIKALNSIDTEVFSSAFLKSEYFSSQSESSNEEIKKLQEIAEIIKSKKLKLYIECNIALNDNAIKALAELCDGFLFTGTKNITAKETEERIEQIKALAPTHTLFVRFSSDFDFEKLSKSNLYNIFIDISSKSTLSAFNTTNGLLKRKGFSVCINTDFAKAEYCDTPLKIIFGYNNYETVSHRSFSGFGAIESNKQNIFSSVKQFLLNGINERISLRGLAITNHNKDIIENTTEFTKELEVYGSDLYPIYLNGKKIASGVTSKKVTLNLKDGENTFVFTQGENKTEYKINFSFTKDIISSILPSGDLTVQPDEKIKIMVIAFSKAEVEIKIGTETFKAKPAEKENLCYTVFTASVKMPKTIQEISSLGMITVIASYNGNTIQQKGAMIIAGEEITTTAPTTQIVESQTAESTTRLVIENYVPTLPQDAYTTTTYTTTQAAPTTQNSAYIQNSSFTGSQMCIVTAPYADTWPLIDNDDTYVPYYTPLIAGTIDYVTAESEAYNSQENETVYFYELSSGRKVKRNNVALIERMNLPSNTLNVLSSESKDGTLKITISSLWKVPYHFDYSDQGYYRAHNKLYNVSSFTASSIRFAFYHTGTASGTVNCSGSNVVSSASWGTSGNVITLTLPLRQKGVYYGHSFEYDANGNIVITIHNKPQTLSGAVILLDPGHGGSDPGALGLSGAVHEKNVNYAIAYYTKLALESKGATVYMTRGADKTVELEERKAIARSLKPDLFVAIHCNGSTKKSEVGTSTYYYKPFSQKLASNIYNRLLTAMKNSIYYGNASMYDAISDGTMYYPFSVTRLEDCPSVLVETAFMSNDTECLALIETQNQQRFAQAIADGIEDTILY